MRPKSVGIMRKMNNLSLNELQLRFERVSLELKHYIDYIVKLIQYKKRNDFIKRILNDRI